VIILKMMALKKSICPKERVNRIRNPSIHSSANVVKMALIMSSTLAHFLMLYINRGAHIRMTQRVTTMRKPEYIGGRQAQMNPITKK
jgi:hypothetical protein